MDYRSRRRQPQAPTRKSSEDVAARRPPPLSPELDRLLTAARERVTVHVHRRRAQGRSADQVLLEVKGLVRKAESLEDWPVPADTLTARVVRWSIEAYYDEPEVASGQPVD